MIVRLKGGLGNQLFQYAAGFAMARRNHVPLMFFFRNPVGAEDRGFAMGDFSLSGQEIPDAMIPASIRVEFDQRARIRTLKTVERIQGTSFYTVRQATFGFDPAVLQPRPRVYLDGSWQSELYFADIRPLLLRELRLTRALSPAGKTIAACIATGDTLAVHVRRGDYVSNPATRRFHGVCSIDYYEQAVRVVRRTRRIGRVVVFTDDGAWVRRSLATLEPSLVLDPSKDRTPCEDLTLMALCSHHIISNSSFGWWGAWLSEREDKVVVAPKHWFDGADPRRWDTSDLLPRSWRQL